MSEAWTVKNCKDRLLEKGNRYQLVQFNEDVSMYIKPHLGYTDVYFHGSGEAWEYRSKQYARETGGEWKPNRNLDEQPGATVRVRMKVRPRKNSSDELADAVDTFGDNLAEAIKSGELDSQLAKIDRAIENRISKYENERKKVVV